jgi:hypothetical protein
MMGILGNHRRLSLLLTASLLAVVSAYGWLRTRAEVSGDAAAHMRRAAAYYDSLIVLERANAGLSYRDSSAVAIGYLERLRLGLGDPFRLAAFALADPRLDQSTRSQLAWAILARLRRGEAYVIDSAVAAAFGSNTRGVAQLALIQRTIESSHDPRVAELTVRLAFALAAGEQTIAEQGDVVATQVGALVRDRVLARSDLRDLLHDADVQQLDPLVELVKRRRDRSFAVEQPASAVLDDALQAEAIDDVPKLLQSIRALSRSSINPSVSTHATAQSPLLGSGTAQRLAALGTALPPEPPIAVTIRTHRSLLVGSDLSLEIRRARAQFAGASNAETLAAEYDLLLASGDTATSTGALAVLAAATSLRAMAQEEPWFPGSPAPSVADLRAEFGLAGVSFDRDVRRDWQPYYLRLIGTSVRDMQRVLGGLSVAGLRIAVASGGLPDTILALHDPATRTIRMSTYSSSGTLAHELAHDLDWQAARSLYAGSGYSTDRAVREQRGPLASSMRDLAAARVVRRGGAPAEERPAEVFARSVDWLVAVSLAREGRSDGYLSAVQDAALTGYTTVSPVAMIFGAARPLVAAVEEMTYLPEAVREGFLAQWADARAVDPYILVRHVLSVPLQRRRIVLSPSPLDDDPLSLTSGRPVPCAAHGDLPPELKARQRLLDLALDARALGMSRMRARWFAAEGRPAWASSVLGVAPWSPAPGELAVHRLRAFLGSQLDAVRGGDQLRFAVPSIFLPSASTCSFSER